MLSKPSSMEGRRWLPMNPRKEKESTVTKGIITPVISMNKAKKPYDNLKILPTVGLWHGSRSWELCFYSSTPGKSDRFRDWFEVIVLQV